MTESTRVRALAERVASLDTLELADLLGIIGVLLAARKIPVGLSVTAAALDVLAFVDAPSRVWGATTDWLRIATRLVADPPPSG